MYHFLLEISRVITADGSVTMELEWSKPLQTFGELRGYRVKVGPKNGPLEEILLEGGQILQHKIQKLGMTKCQCPCEIYKSI
jgi:netrin-G3 ligand